MSFLIHLLDEFLRKLLDIMFSMFIDLSKALFNIFFERDAFL